MSGNLARIILRYGIGFLSAYGLLKADLAAQLVDDPDIAAIISYLISGAAVSLVEGWYWLAKKKGWKL